MNPDERRKALLEAALGAARRVGLHGLTREHVARAAGCSDGLVSARLGTMDDLRDAVKGLARRRGIKLAAFGPHEDDQDERLWTAGRLGADTSYRLLVTGPMGTGEVGRLIEQLQGQAVAIDRAGN